MEDLAAESAGEQCTGDIDGDQSSQFQSTNSFQRAALSLQDARQALQWLAAFHAFFWEHSSLVTETHGSTHTEGNTNANSTVEANTQSTTGATAPLDSEDQGISDDNRAVLIDSSAQSATGSSEPVNSRQLHVQDLVGKHLWSEGKTQAPRHGVHQVHEWPCCAV